MKPHSADAPAIQALWDVLRGIAIPERLPTGISMLATRHNCAAALYSALDRAGARDAVDYADWCLLRGFAFFHRTRARRFRELLALFAAEAPAAPWYVWKGAALLLALDGYDEHFEAGDIDIAVQPGALDAWAGLLTRNGATILKRGTHGFSARFDADATQPAIVLDLKEEPRMPPLVLASGIPVPAPPQHFELMRAHAQKHASLPAPKLRMVYDAWLAGAEWHDEMYRLLFPAAYGVRRQSPPLSHSAESGSEGAASAEIAGDGCTVLIDANRSFAFDRNAVERSLPRLLARPEPRHATARLELRLDAEADPYGLEERSDRTVLWVRQSPSPRENKRLIAALVQRAYQSIGLLTLHCTVVTRGDRAVALLGTFGSGKTLTSVGMSLNGAALLAGDAALVADGRVIGGTREAWLDRALRDRYFPHLGDNGDPRIDVAEDLPWVPRDSAPPALAALIFISVSPVPASESFVTPLAAETATQNLFRASAYRFDNIIPSCGLALTDLEPRAQRQWRLDQCRALTASVPAFRVGGSLDHAAGTALGLLESIDPHSIPEQTWQPIAHTT